MRKSLTAGPITWAYRAVVRMHSGLPYHLSRGGHALPAWHYFFEVTRRCNLRCKMCQYIEYLEHVPAHQQRADELSTEEWLDVIDQTQPLGLITFTGGEVWLRKDFSTILEHACKKRRVHFITNGVLLDEERAARCIELAPKIPGGVGLNFVGVSIDGTESIHDQIRAQQGAYRKSIQAIERLVARRKASRKTAPYIHINTVILNDNIDVLPDLPDLAAAAGAQVLNLLTEMRGPDNQELGHVDPATFHAEDVNTTHIDRSRLRDALRETRRRARAAGIELRMPRMPDEEIVEHYDGGYDLRHMACHSIWTNLYVGAKGGVYPCFLQKVGNVREQPLRTLWNSPQMRAFRTRRRTEAFEVCRGCCEMEHCRKPLAAKRLADTPQPATPINTHIT